jgi:HD-GYP domain-containing protein (c-di-GMP phosphodiesterase class II)
MNDRNVRYRRRRTTARRAVVPDMQLLGVAIVIGLGAVALGHRAGRDVVALGGGVLLGVAGLAAVLAVRRLQRELARRPDTGERAHRIAPAASLAPRVPEAPQAPTPARDTVEPAGFSEAIGALAAQLRSTTSGNPRRDQVMIETLDRFLESHGGETANHTFRVGEMARELALLAGLPAQEAELLRQAAPLHDLGQAGIPAAILDKPGRFTAREFALMKKHTTVGHRILSQSDRPELRAAAIIALQHHERWDGLGYPQRLQGEDIHLHGRIVSLVDAFDAMFCRRSYRKELTLEQALGIIRTQRAHHFDPRLHDLFMENLPVFTDIVKRYADAPPAETAPKPAPSLPRRRVPVGAGAGGGPVSRER